MAANKRSNNRNYLFSEAQTRLFFVVSGVGMVATLVGLLILASARPQGSFKQLERSTYLNTITAATNDLTGYKQNANGSVSIPIERAMELVVERGVVNPFNKPE